MTVSTTILLIVFIWCTHICSGEVIIERETDDFIVTKRNVPAAFQPTWESLDSRELPEWFDRAKVGIFIHWGVFSVPSFGSEWFWANWKENNREILDFLAKNYKPKFSYQDFAHDFTAEFFNATEWAAIFKNSGAKYVILTSKHHEGYTLWPSKYSYSWNSLDVGPHRDLIGELSKAVRDAKLDFGLYHSLYEWYNPIYEADKASNFTKANFVVRKVVPEMTELIEKYLPSVLWSDGDWEATDEYWQSKQFLAWLFNESPVKDNVVVNDRWGRGIPCHHGDFYTCEDRYNPGVLQKHKWENAMTIDKKSWGFRRNAKLEEYMTTQELITTLIETVSCGGNILMNVGPTKDGIIAPIFQDRLRDIGIWLSINGEAIYDSKPWTMQNDTIGTVWYTANGKGDNIYATTLIWPKDNLLRLQSALNLFKTSDTIVHMLGNEDTKLKWSINKDIVQINLPDKAVVRSQWAWILKINNFKQ